MLIGESVHVMSPSPDTFLLEEVFCLTSKGCPFCFLVVYVWSLKAGKEVCEVSVDNIAEEEEWIRQDHLHHAPVVCCSFFDSVRKSGSTSLLEVFSLPQTVLAMLAATWINGGGQWCIWG